MCLLILLSLSFSFFFFFNDTATTEIYTLSLHDALPISSVRTSKNPHQSSLQSTSLRHNVSKSKKTDRKSTRLNSSHTVISYAVFCLKKKKQKSNKETTRNHTNNKHNRTQPQTEKLIKPN